MVMKKTFTLNRSGELTVYNKSLNQCGTIGHNNYDYYVRLKCSDKLNREGFVIDHHIIDNNIRAITEIKSCELLCKKIESLVAKILKDNGIKPLYIYIRVRARQPESLNYAFMEYEIEY